MAIGSFGDVVFTASANEIRTFDDLQQSGTARYAEHAVLGAKPLLEFIGPGLEEISFKVKLDSSCGVDPDAEFKSLQEIRDSGEVCTLIFGDTKIGKFVLESISVSEGPRGKDGRATWIEAGLTIKEYIEHE